MRLLLIWSKTTLMLTIMTFVLTTRPSVASELRYQLPNKNRAIVAGVAAAGLVATVAWRYRCKLYSFFVPTSRQADQFVSALRQRYAVELPLIRFALKNHQQLSQEAVGNMLPVQRGYQQYMTTLSADIARVQALYDAHQATLPKSTRTALWELLVDLTVLDTYADSYASAYHANNRGVL